MNLEASIAKLNLGELSLSQFPEIAMKALEEGIESESLVILAGINDSENSFEIREYLDCVIKELGIISHQSLSAGFVLANAYVESFKIKEIDIIECIYRIKNECWDNCQNEIESNEYLYDGIKFDKIIGPWYEYNEIDVRTAWVKESGKSVSQLKLEIKQDLENMILKWQSEYLNDKIKSLSR